MTAALRERLEKLGDYLSKHDDGVCRLEADAPDEAAATIAELMSALTNAKFALEYWDREARVCAKSVPWAMGPFERGAEEIARADAALSKAHHTEGGDR